MSADDLILLLVRRASWGRSGHYRVTEQIFQHIWLMFRIFILLRSAVAWYMTSCWLQFLRTKCHRPIDMKGKGLASVAHLLSPSSQAEPSTSGSFSCVRSSRDLMCSHASILSFSFGNITLSILQDPSLFYCGSIWFGRESACSPQLHGNRWLSPVLAVYLTFWPWPPAGPRLGLLADLLAKRGCLSFGNR